MRSWFPTVCALPFLLAGQADGQAFDDHGDTAERATFLTIGGSALGTIDPGDDVDYFEIRHPPDISELLGVSIYTTGLLDLLGTYQISSSIVHRGDLSRGLQIFKGVTTSVFVKAESVDGQTGSYVIWAFSTGYDNHSNTTQNATVLVLNRPTPGFIPVDEDDVDYFKVEAPAGGVQISVSGNSPRRLPTAILEAPPGNELEGLTYAGEGALYIRVEKHGTEFGRYTILATPFRDDHGNVRSDATSLTLSNPVSGVIEEPGDDVDYFKIEVPAGGARILTTGDLNTIGTLENVSAETLVVSDDDGDAMNFALNATAAGTFHIKVESFSSHIGNYTIFAFPLSGDEYGNTIATATPLILSSPAPGMIDPGRRRGLLQSRGSRGWCNHIYDG